MKPFFRLLRTREMPLDVLSTMVEITTFMQQREYVKAHGVLSMGQRPARALPWACWEHAVGVL